MKKYILLVLILNTKILVSSAQEYRTVVERLVEKFAPLVYMHSDEQYNLSTVDWYLSRVRKINRSGDAILLNVDTSNIITQGDHGDNTALKHKSFATRYGDLNGAVCYVNVISSYFQNNPLNEHDIDIQYHYFYPHNGGNGWHEGDWEMVQIKISKGSTTLWKIKKIGISSHGNMKWYNPDQLAYYPYNHPIVYSAKYTHAFYESEGAYCGNLGDVACALLNKPDRTNKGARFESWKNYEIIDIDDNIQNHLTTVKSHNWMNYIGKWGGDAASFLFWYIDGWGGPTGPITSYSREIWNGKRQDEQLNYYPDYRGGLIRSSSNGPVEILGPSEICNSGSSTYTPIVVPANMSVVEWKVSPNNLVDIISENSSELIISPKSNISRGILKIVVKVRTDYGDNGFQIDNNIYREIWVGPPGYETSHQEIQGPRTIAQGTFGDFDITIGGVGTYNWTVPSNWSKNYVSSSTVQIGVGNSGSGTYQISYQAMNNCGFPGFHTTKTVEVIDVGSGNGPPSHYVQRVNLPELDTLTNSDNNSDDGSFGQNNSSMGLTTALIKEYSSYENLADASFIYPNPAGNEVNVLIKNFDGEQQSQVFLLDLNGQIMLSKTILSSNGTLDISSFENGIYFVRINNNQETTVRKLIIQN